VVSNDSDTLSGGRIVGIRLASIVFPEPVSRAFGSPRCCRKRCNPRLS
jgi:hypothetical protein